MALALNSKVRGTTFARSAVFAPYVLSGVGVGLVWLFIFDPGYGVLSWLLRGLGPAEPAVDQRSGTVAGHGDHRVRLEEPGLLRRGVPGRTAVAAERCNGGRCPGRGGTVSAVSSASPLPLLSPTTFFLLITTMLSSLQAFDLIRIMTPLGSGTSTLIYEAYLQAFGAYNRAGYSAAISVVLFAILLVITVLQLRFVERKVHYS